MSDDVHRVAQLKLRDRPGVDVALDGVLWRCRNLYNAALQERRDAYQKYVKGLPEELRQPRLVPSWFDQCKALTTIRTEDRVYRSLDCHMLRITVLRRLDLAFKAFFARCKLIKMGKLAKEKAGYPRFKSRDRFSSLVFGPAGWKLSCGKLYLHGIGTFPYTGKIHRDGKPIGLRLTKKAGRWYAGVILDCGEAPVVKPAQNMIGIDVGIKTFATMSDGSQVAHPHFLKKSLADLAEAQRKLSTKTSYRSRRRQKAKAAISRLHHKIACKRKDFVWQTAAELNKRYDGFAVEKLDIAGMASVKEDDNSKQATGLRRNIMDSAWGMFLFALACKAGDAGKPFVAVNPRGTSQRCSECGGIVKKTLRDRVHVCPWCGLVLDRDVNAARNIYDLGWRSAPAVSGAEDPS